MPNSKRDLLHAALDDEIELELDERASTVAAPEDAVTEERDEPPGWAALGIGVS